MGRRAQRAPGLILEPRLDATMRPAMAQYLALLPLPAADLEDMLERALTDNPLLVRAPGGPCTGCGRHCASAAYCPSCATAPLPADPTAITGWRERYEQDARLELPAPDHGLLARVVGSLDEHGLLPEGVLAPAPDPADLDRILTALRRVGPPGIAAATPLDCVRCQVTELVAAGRAPPLAEALFRDHAADIAAGRLDDVAARLGERPDAVADALSVVRERVTPYVALEDADPRPRVVDVSFRRPRDGGALEVEVTGASWFGVELDEELWAWASGTARDWLRPHRDAALRVLAGLRARGGLLQGLGVLLADRQRGFLLDGPAAHRPLTRADAAGALGCHPSTVGRAVEDKWARCPDGRVVPLSAFFGTSTSVRSALAELLAAEPEASDETLRRLLGDRGFTVARRTVTKYRHQLRPPARRAG